MPFSFIILTYNSASYIKEFLDSIFKVLETEIRNGKIELILYDNNSTDDTVKIAESFGTSLTIKRSSENLGYAKGINKATLLAKGEYIVVLNPDAKLIEFDSEKIIEEFEKDKLLAIAGLPMEDYSGKSEKTAGNFFNHFTFLMYSLGLESASGIRFASPSKRVVDFVSGGFVVFRKKIFEELSGYDEDYFMYVEDMDICFRAKRAGYKVMYLTCAKLQHKGQGSSNREFAITNIFKGLLHFYKKNKAGINPFYIRCLLRFKAALIIFVGHLFGKKETAQIYKKALKTLS